MYSTQSQDSDSDPFLGPAWDNQPPSPPVRNKGPRHPLSPPPSPVKKRGRRFIPSPFSTGPGQHPAAPPVSSLPAAFGAGGGAASQSFTFAPPVPPSIAPAQRVLPATHSGHLASSAAPSPVFSTSTSVASSTGFMPTNASLTPSMNAPSTVSSSVPQQPSRTVNDQQQSRLFRLPREVRDLIYKELVTVWNLWDPAGEVSPETWQLRVEDERRREPNDHGRMALSLTCRLANNEVGEFFYHQHRRAIDCSDQPIRLPPRDIEAPAFPAGTSTALANMPVWFVLENSRGRLEAIRTLSLWRVHGIWHLKETLAIFSGLKDLRKLVVSVDNAKYSFDDGYTCSSRDLENDKEWLQWARAQWPLLETFELEYKMWPYKHVQPEDVDWADMNLRSVIVRGRMAYAD